MRFICVVLLLVRLMGARPAQAQECESPRGIREQNALELFRWQPHGTCYAVAVEGGGGPLAANSGETMRLYDLSVPAHPRATGQACLRGQGQLAAYREGLLLVSTYREDGLEIIDPGGNEIGFVRLDGIHGFAVEGALVYAASYGGSMVIIDISNPRQPIERGRYITEGRPAHCVVANRLAYLTVWNKGLEIVDIADPASPRRVGGIADPSISYFATDGTRGILGRWNSTRLDLLDLSSGTSPVAVGSLQTSEPGIAIEIRIRGNIVFVVGEGFWNGFRTLDISDMRAPRLLGDFHPKAGGGTIAFEDNFAYVSGWTEGTNVVDVSDPANPRLEDQLDTPAVFADVAIDGHLALVANASDGLRVFHLTSTAIEDAGATYTFGTFYGVAARGGYAFVGSEYEDLRIFRYSSAGPPIEVATVPTPGIATRVVLDGSRVYVADGPGGLHVADVTRPEFPVDLGGIDTPGETVDVAVIGGRAYLADRSGGFASSTCPQCRAKSE